LAFYGFKANVEQSPETINGIKYMLSFVPAISALLSGIFIYFYKLDAKTLKTIEADLAIRREAEGVKE